MGVEHLLRARKKKDGYSAGGTISVLDINGVASSLGIVLITIISTLSQFS